MEVEPVDLLRGQRRSFVAGVGFAVGERGWIGRQPHRAGEVHGALRLAGAGQGALGRQPALGDQVVPVGVQQGRDRHRAWLVPVELERRPEVHVLDSGHVQVGHEQPGGLGERLHAHHAGQHRRAVDAVVIQERPGGRVQRGLHHQPVVHTGADDLADHRPVCRQ